jgi:hypothetical protein
MDGRGPDDATTIDRDDTGASDTLADRVRLSLLGSQAAVDICLLLLALAALVLLKSDWLFNTSTYVVDAWMYLGYFLHYDLPTMLADNKKIARLPWILSGYLAHSMFSPTVATYTLHLGYFASGVIGLYLVISRLLNSTVALLVTAFYVAHFIVHGTGGWDYHNAAAGPFYLFSYLSLMRAADDERRPAANFFIFGILFALTIHSNVLFLNLLPALLIQAGFQIWQRRSSWQIRWDWFARAAAGAVLGVVLCTVLLGSINVMAGRDFLFFKTLLVVSTVLIENPERELAWWESWGSLWWAINAGFVFPAATVVASLISFTVDAGRRLMGGRRSVPWSVRQALCLEFLVTMAITGVWQTLGHPILQPSYMAYPVYYPMLLAMAALIAGCLPARGLDKSVVLRIVIVAIPVGFLALDLALPQNWLLFPKPLPQNPNFWTILAVGMLVAVVLSSGWERGRGRGIIFAVASCLAFSVTLALANAQLAERELDMTSSYRGPYNAFDRCMQRKDAYSLIVRIHQFIFRSFRDKLLAGKDPDSIRIWFDPNEVMGTEACHVNGRQLAVPVLATGFGYIMPWYDMRRVGDIPATYLAELDPWVTPVVVITNNPASAEQMLVRLRQYRQDWQITERTEAVADDIRVAAYILGTPDSVIAAHTKSVAFDLEVASADVRVSRREKGGWTITTPDQRWAFSAELKPQLHKIAGPGSFVIRVQVTSGNAAVGVLNAVENDFVTRRVVPATRFPVDVELPVPDLAAHGRLIVQNGREDGRTEIVISEMQYRSVSSQ